MIDWNQPIELDPPWSSRRLRGIDPEFPLYYIHTRAGHWRVAHTMPDLNSIGEALGPDYLVDNDEDGFLVDAQGRPCHTYVEDGAAQTLGLDSLSPNEFALALIK